MFPVIDECHKAILPSVPIFVAIRELGPFAPKYAIAGFAVDTDRRSETLNPSEIDKCYNSHRNTMRFVVIAEQSTRCTS